MVPKEGHILWACLCLSLFDGTFLGSRVGFVLVLARSGWVTSVTWLVGWLVGWLAGWVGLVAPPHPRHHRSVLLGPRAAYLRVAQGWFRVGCGLAEMLKRVGVGLFEVR